jgi:hypothetical protein
MSGSTSRFFRRASKSSARSAAVFSAICTPSMVGAQGTRLAESEASSSAGRFSKVLVTTMAPAAANSKCTRPGCGAYIRLRPTSMSVTNRSYSSIVIFWISSSSWPPPSSMRIGSCRLPRPTKRQRASNTPPWQARRSAASPISNRLREAWDSGRA